jgi:hypothetical protein
MTAIVLPDIDRSTVEELKKKIPNLAEIELPQMPSMERVGKNADETIDRLLGRQKASAWPWVAAGIGLVAVIGALAAYFAWFRRPTYEASDTWSSTETTPEPATPGKSTTAPADDLIGRPVTGAGLTAAESSLASSPYPGEDA